ncbi:MAG: pyruvate synthase [Desulfocapsaceae bacterium]|nr:pyruvate synthase [Desulfocapsaceae bacterium]
MNKQMLTGNVAAAWGARLAGIDYLPAFPISPQTEIIETVAEWIDTGAMDASMTTMDSEHSMLTAAGGAAATGVRVFTATSSQGLLYGMEMIYALVGWRVPLVLVNVSRGLAAPITLEPDHNDVLAARDSGFLQLHCSTCQEVLDSILMAYRLAEDRRVRLPVLVNLDGFYLSYTREPVIIPDLEEARQFVGPYDPGTVRFAAQAPVSEAVAVLGGESYSYFRYEVQMAQAQALAVYGEIAAEFAACFGREQARIDAYRAEDAEYLFLMIGSFATKAMDAVDQLREAGWKIGLLRPRLLRPFPEQDLRQLAAGKKGMAVIDQNLSFGRGGILHTEVTSSLYGQSGAPSVIASFVGGLGGRDIAAEEFYQIAQDLRQACVRGIQPPMRLLYTAAELTAMRNLQAIANVPAPERKP